MNVPYRCTRTWDQQCVEIHLYVSTKLKCNRSKTKILLCAAVMILLPKIVW